MTQTDRILGNIAAIKTLLENFPMGLLERDGKQYTSAFEFILDVLRCCGVSDREIIDFLVEKIYGFEGKPGFTINGLYELLKTENLNINTQNNFINGLETSIKIILMELFTSIYTCSALPILPNKVFNYDGLNVNGVYLMDDVNSDLYAITCENSSESINRKIKVPISLIDLLGMLSINPTSSQGKLYYLVDGIDRYYKKEQIEYTETQEIVSFLSYGKTYRKKIDKYAGQYKIKFEHVEYDQYNKIDTWRFFVNDGNVSPLDVIFKVSISLPNDTVINKTVSLKKGANSSDSFNTTRYENSTSYIQNITMNGYICGFDVYNSDDNLYWLYLSKTEDNDDGFSAWYTYYGSEVNQNILGKDHSDDKIIDDSIISEETGETVTEIIENTKIELTYKELSSFDDNNSQLKGKAIRYSYVPSNNFITNESPEYIVCYDGQNPGLLYKTYDMNAFIWYCVNRGNKVNQTEINHLMWDSRVSARNENETSLGSSSNWNRWYSSKEEEGGELIFYSVSGTSDIYYPIIQIEPYKSRSEILIRIPSQRYFLPKKRKDLLNGNYDNNNHYFNASVYKFDWEYLKNIQLLNPRLMLTRFIEHLLGFSINEAMSSKANLIKKEIEKKLSTVVKSLIMANDMEIEDCWKSFSNEEFNDLLNELILERYKSSEYNGEVIKTREHNIDNYVYRLNDINSNTNTEGTITNIKKLVNDIMLDPGIEPSTEWDFSGKFDSNMLSKLIWAIVMPIVESLFTPQIMLLIMINFQLLGVVNVNSSIGNDFTKLMNLLINKIFGLTKSIVLFIKDKIVSLLIDLFNDIIKNILQNSVILLLLERITDWLVILLNAVKCIPLMTFGSNKTIGYIEDVDYADIVNVQNIPESQSECT